jgi:hypothetical protein
MLEALIGLPRGSALEQDLKSNIIEVLGGAAKRREVVVVVYGYGL